MDYNDFIEFAYDNYEINTDESKLQNIYHEIGWEVANNRELEESWLELASEALYEHYDQKEN